MPRTKKKHTEKLKRGEVQPLVDVYRLRTEIVKSGGLNISPEQKKAAKDLVASFHGDEVLSWGEDEKRPSFLDRLFCDVLGYTKTDSINRSGNHVTFATEFTGPMGKRPDGILGYFDVDTLNSHDAGSLYPVGIIEVEDASYQFGASRSDKNKGVDQAFDYSVQFKNPRRIPRIKIVTNFVELRIYDQTKFEAHTIDLRKLGDDRVLEELFYFLAPKNLIPELKEDSDDGQVHKTNFQQLKEDLEAEQREGIQVSAERASEMGQIHNTLLQLGFSQLQADQTVVRLAFLMFADDTEIINNHAFTKFLERLMDVEPSVRLFKLVQLFTAVDTKDKTHRQRLAPGFPYINGGLFRGAAEEMNTILDKDLLSDDLVKELYHISQEDWSKVNPIVFGSMYEGAMDQKERHNIGAYYTSESDILKLINGMFMNDLRKQFELIKDSDSGTVAKLLAFKRRLAGLSFLDPACGSGNFLVVAYRELRRLEHQVVNEIMSQRNQSTQILDALSTLDALTYYGFDGSGNLVAKDKARSLKTWQPLVGVEVSQFSGIELGIPYVNELGEVEYNGYPINIAKTGMWMMDHLMNLEFSEMMAIAPIIRLPLHEAAHIHQGNALTLDWNKVVPLDTLDYILGNPPFIGSRSGLMTPEQKEELRALAGKQFKSINSMDYVTGWYIKAIQAMSVNKNIVAAFVSTNTITQGSQGRLLADFFNKKKIVIYFAHQTFEWTNKGASVHVVIIGFMTAKHFNSLVQGPVLYTYKELRADPEIEYVDSINGYLKPQRNYSIPKLTNRAVNNLPEMTFGSQLLDGGKLYLSDEEEQELYNQAPQAKDEHWVRLIYGSQEIATCKPRKVLYLNEVPRDVRESVPLLREKAALVKEFRLNQAEDNQQKPAVYKEYKALAEEPYNYLMSAARPYEHEKIIVPRITATSREYMTPIVVGKYVMTNDQAFQIAGNDLFIVGLLSSHLHLVWLKQFGGKRKSDYRYSNEMVYNTFVVPQATDAEKQLVREQVKKIVAIRDKYINEGKNIRNLYNAKKMPADLRQAHLENDKLIEGLYRKEAFEDDQERIDFLYDLLMAKLEKIAENK